MTGAMLGGIGMWNVQARLFAITFAIGRGSRGGFAGVVGRHRALDHRAPARTCDYMLGLGWWWFNRGRDGQITPVCPRWAAMLIGSAEQFGICLCADYGIVFQSRDHGAGRSWCWRFRPRAKIWGARMEARPHGGRAADEFFWRRPLTALARLRGRNLAAPVALGSPGRGVSGTISFEACGCHVRTGAGDRVGRRAAYPLVSSRPSFAFQIGGPIP